MSSAALVESAPDAIVLVDCSGRITLVNQRTEELFGYARDELLDERIELLVPERFPTVHPAHRAEYGVDPKTREMGTGLELYGCRSDGSEFPVEISLSPIGESDDSQVITIIRDVTGRRRAATRFGVLLESAPDAIVLGDSSGRIALANRRAEELFGYELGELVGREVELLVPERFRSAHLDHRAAYATDPRTREMGAGLELYGQRKDGSEFPVEISLTPEGVGPEELVIAIVRDVSDRRAAELERLTFAREQAAHAEAEAGRNRLASILGEIDAIVWEADAHRQRFSFVSKRAEDVLGYPLSAWLHEDDFWRRIVEPEDRPLAELYFQEAIGRACDHDYEYRVRSADGQELWVRDLVRVVRSGDEELRLRGVMVDVTARRELEERLLQSQKMDAIGQLAGGVAHDFNNLLVVISGYTDLLLGRVEDDASLAQLREISQAARRAGELIAQLLAFGRRAPRVSEVVDLNTLIRGIEPMLRRLIDEDIGLTIEIAPALGPVCADSGQLEQVLVNLVINARDAMPLGGEIRIQTADLEVAEAAAAELGLTAGRYLALRVADNGSGMTSETKARIFEPFFTTKEQGRGTGLGLATIYGIVQQADGRIAVETELGRGSTFSIYLPATTVSDEEIDEPGDRGSVLVVDDEAAIRRLVRSVLEGEGYHVHEAANGREALAYLERQTRPVDLILTDVVMPDITGPELAARLARLGHSPRVLFMSGYADSQLLGRGLNESSISVIGKPFTGEQLKTRVAELILLQESPERRAE
jgi:two-component system, cell cycle sensor histidine kinase and response regulator CckA